MRSAWFLLILFLVWTETAHADWTRDQMERVASGQFDAVVAFADAQGPRADLPASHLHLVCYALAKTKRYGALEKCLDSLEARLSDGDRDTLLFGLDDPTPHLHLMRGEAALDMGRYDAATSQARQALDWMARNDQEEAIMVIEARALLALSRAFASHPDDARAQLPLIAAAGKSFFGDDNKTSRSLALARVHMALGNYRLAYEAISSDRTFKLDAFLDNLFSGAAFRGRDNWLWQDLPRAYMLSRALLGMGDSATARDRLDQLLAIPEARLNGEIFWMASHDRGRIAELDGQPDLAIRHYRDAITTIEAQRASINTEANKIGFIGDKQAVYPRLIRLLSQQGRATEALEYVERARSRALVDLLAGKQDWRGGGREEVTRLVAGQAAEDEQRGAQGESGGTATGLGESLRRLREVDPDTAALVSVTTLPVDRIQALLDPGETLLEYFLAGDELDIFVLSRDQIHLTRTDGKKLLEEVRALRACIQARDRDCKLAAGRLHQRLIAPVETWLGDGKLTIVPHGPLHYLPFAALWNGQQYFLERHAYTILPSASVLPFIPPHRDGAGPPLVLANPDLGSRFLDLPNTEREAREVVRALGQGEVLTRKAASEAGLRRRAGRPGVLHLATHGDFAADRPLASALLLSPGDGQDGRLTVDEIYGLALRADLVVLSACETGLGKVNTGDDVVGLSRGFLYAGARRVLGSLWSVDDASTTDLMAAYYRERNRLDDAQALRQAQLALMARYPQPYYWAAFYLTGK